ncbi:MAG: hypothetical protein DWQ06_01775 [Calditrichaeota bacterium]|nr:MAG: hypothetical protein DWQ06_01775 [Calditrichota bacterium]
MKSFFLFCFFILFFASKPSLACDYCLVSQGISPLETSKGIGIRVEQRYTKISKKLNNHSDGIPKESHWTTQFAFYYSLTPKLTFVSVLPVVYRNSSSTGFSDFYTLTKPNHGSGEEVLGSSFGIGDATFLARYQFYQRHSLNSTFSTAIQTGIKVPFGSTTSKNEEGELLDSHLQPGTGSFDFAVGLSTSYAYKRVNFFSNFLLVFPTEGEVGSESYQFGKNLNFDTSFRWRLNKNQFSDTVFFHSLGLAGEIHAKEKLAKQTLVNTGGKTVYFTTGLQVQFQNFFLPISNFETSVWIPFYHDLNGEQIGETVKVFFGFTYSIR